MTPRHPFPTFAYAAREALSWYQSANYYKKFAASFVITSVFVYLVYLVVVSAPFGYPSGLYVTVPKGATLTSIAQELERQGIIKYAFVLKASARALGNDKKIPAGVYYFARPENAVQIAIRLVAGDFDTTPVRITVPEGATVSDISKLLLQKMPQFNIREFLSVARGKEGYLFPDTYFFMPGDDVDSILSVFSNGFHVHINKVQTQIDAFKKPLPEVLTMASLLEKEAADTTSRRIISGILWNRIKKGMPLQVDAVFPYIIGKNSFNLTRADLAVDNPYNTYKYKGLPPGPIANPGLDSILAAINPTPSNYVFYLSDLNGDFHYCATYDCHLANKHKYLD